MCVFVLLLNGRAHMQTHSAFKHFRCERCNKSFALKSYLNKHYESSCFKDSNNKSEHHSSNGNFNNTQNNNDEEKSVEDSAPSNTTTTTTTTRRQTANSSVNGLASTIATTVTRSKVLQLNGLSSKRKSSLLVTRPLWIQLAPLFRNAWGTRSTPDRRVACRRPLATGHPTA